ncbi:hypothetical protein ACNKHN_03530 [Shigella flexneri]
MPPEAEHSPAYKEIIHATGKRRKHCDKDGDKERKNKAHLEWEASSNHG